MTADSDFVLHESGLGYTRPPKVTPEEQARREARREAWLRAFGEAYVLAGLRRR